MATSGTVNQTVFNTGKVIDHAFRRCRIAPQQITPEYINTAKELLYISLSTLASKGIALWAIDKAILSMYEGYQTVPLPQETVDVLNANLRTSSRLEGTYTSSEGIADFAFDGDLLTSCTQFTPAGEITIELPSETDIYTFGILPNASGSWNIAIQTSTDGVTWTDRYRNTALAMLLGEWFWVDIQGVNGVSFVRLQAFGTTVLDVIEFVQQTLSNEIPLAKVNRDDYSDLPNKTFRGRPTEFWYDKKRSPPLLQLWPSPSEQYTFSQIILFTQRYLEDVGALTQDLEIPRGWYLPVVLDLAKHLSSEIPEVKPDVKMSIIMDAREEMDKAWASQTDGAPSYIIPNISPYTR